MDGRDHYWPRIHRGGSQRDRLRRGAGHCSIRAREDEKCGPAAACCRHSLGPAAVSGAEISRDDLDVACRAKRGSVCGALLPNVLGPDQFSCTAKAPKGIDHQPEENRRMFSLADCEKQSLLEISRRALVAAVELREFTEDLPQVGNLARPVGAFVTLRRRSRLRGCMGQLASNDTLVQVVVHCARSAALEDPRFEPVRTEEIGEIEIELSVLSPLQNVVLSEIEPGTHGLVVTKGWKRGVLLPQVAREFGWNAERFLGETCIKAGLDRSAWKEPDTRIQAFTADIFSESILRCP